MTKQKHLIGSIVCGILTAFGIIASVISLIGGGGSIWMIADIILLLLSFLIGYYALKGYKKPHGNLLRYIILIYAFSTLFAVLTLIQAGSTWPILFATTKIGLLCYVAGRLIKAKQNLFLMILITICDIVLCVSQVSAATATIGAISKFVVWLDICVAYFLRYKEHKEAGLQDAPKK